MIKANKILATEWLPKFGEQVEKAYGIENVNRIENIQTALNRLKNEWISLVKSFEASGAFSNIIENIKGIFERLRFEFNPEDFINNAALNESKTLYDDIIKKVQTLGNEEKIKAAIISEIQLAYAKQKEYAKELVPLEGKRLGQLSLSEEKALMFWKTNHEGVILLQKDLNELLKDPKKFNALFNPEPIDEKVIDERLASLQAEYDMATGIIEKLEAQKKINDYLLSKASSGKRIKELNEINKELEKQIKFYSDLGKEVDKIESINVEKQIEERNKRQQKIAKEGQDKLRQIQLDNFYDMIQDREGFADQIGLNDKEMYETELKYLEYFHRKYRLTEKQYLIQRVSLWMRYNDLTIDSVEQFAQNFNSLLSEINQGQIDSAQKEVDIQEDKLSELKSQLDKEKELKDEGKANDYDRTVTQIAETQKLKDEANKKLEQAQKREAKIQLASQASDIITATANIIAGWTEINPVAGVLIGLAQVAAMVTAFVSYKNKINSISKYAEGEVDINGKPHSEGGKVVEIEGGESIIKKKATQQSKRLLSAINEGLVSDFDLYKLNLNTDLSKSNYQRYDSTSEMLNELKQSRVTNEAMLNHMKNTPVIAVMPDGRLVEIYGKYKTKVVTLK
jgi:hypothetical protein